MKTGSKNKMLMDPKKLSEVIRMKKKKMMNAEPELVDSGLQADMNPNSIYDNEVNARIQSTIMSPAKINAEVKELDEDDNVGVTPEEKARMPRLRSYLDTLDMGM